MTEVDRDIALALLKCLHKRGLIADEAYISAVGSRVFDKRHFSDDTESVRKTAIEGDGNGADDQMASGAAAAGQVDL